MTSHQALCKYGSLTNFQTMVEFERNSYEANSNESGLIPFQINAQYLKTRLLRPFKTIFLTSKQIPSSLL